jgi:Peptidase family M28
VSRLLEIVRVLAAISGRGACTDAERRACTEVRDEIRGRARPARMEPYWVRPQWPAAWAAHAALGVTASLLSVSLPAVGLGLVVATLVSYVLDVTGRAHLLRALFRRRATQVVVSEPPEPRAPVRLVITAGVDAPRTGAVFADRWARAETRARRALGGHLSSPPATLAFLLFAIAALGVARLAGGAGQTLGAVQLIPSVGLLVAAGVLIDIALSPPSAGANADASAVAVALALGDALAESPPRNLDVELALAGAGDGRQLGMRSYVRERRRARRAEEVAVLALGPCGAGRPRFYTSEGLLFPLRLHPRLIDLARTVATREAHLGARAARRGYTGALPARAARWPAISVACLDEHDRPPRARQPDDTADALDPAALSATLELCLALIAALDADLQGVQTVSRGGETVR